MKRVGLVVLCTLIGLAAGAIWTLAQPDRYRADARVLVHPLSPAVETLAESSVVEANVAQTLHLSSPPDVSAHSGKGGVLTISVEAGQRERARQIGAEAVVVLTQKVPQRLAGTTTTVLDPAHVAEQTSPTPGRNLLLTGLAGLVVGIALAFALSPRARPVTAEGVDPRVERRLQARIDQVARRERALAQRAGQLAAREQDLDRREAALDVVPAPKEEPQPEVEPERVVPQPRDGWTIEALEELMQQRAAREPYRRDELAAYVVYLRDYSDSAGRLPSQFDSLIAEVFLA